MTEDVILVAVLTARAVAKRLVRIQKLNSLYREEVETMRTDTVKTTVNALWRRYGAGPVSAVHGRCGVDISRGSLRLIRRGGTE